MCFGLGGWLGRLAGGIGCGRGRRRCLGIVGFYFMTFLCNMIFQTIGSGGLILVVVVVTRYVACISCLLLKRHTSMTLLHI